MIKIELLPNWDVLMAGFINERRSTPFAWGANDCCSFAIHAVARFTGTVVVPITWTDEESAVAELAAVGGLEAGCTSALGEPSDNYRTMRQGDVGIVSNGNHESLVLCTGYQVCAPAIDAHLAFMPFRMVRKHWRIG